MPHCGYAVARMQHTYTLHVYYVCVSGVVHVLNVVQYVWHMQYTARSFMQMSQVKAKPTQSSDTPKHQNQWQKGLGVGGGGGG